MHSIKKILHRLYKLPLWYKIGGAVVLASLVVGLHAVTRAPAEATPGSDTVAVRVASVASLSDQTGPLPVTGKVSSISKASILAVSSGEIVSLSRSLGDRVAAGSVIATFENSSQRAAVLQAQGAYEAAQAALAKANGSTAPNSDLASAQAAQSAQNAATAATLALRSAYASLDDAVYTKADSMFSNPHSNLPQLNVAASDNQLVINANNERSMLDPVLASAKTLSEGSPADIDAAITSMIAKAQTVENFLGDVVAALNKAIPTNSVSASTISSYQTTAAAARSEVISAISSLTTAKSNYDAAVSGAATAANSANAGSINDIASAQANVKSALGALNAAQANLEKTIIRAPISGTIVSLSLTRGGYVSSFSQVAQISNPGALEVETYVTSDDAKTLAVGGKATIEGGTKGVIVFIAPALDPTTGKIQVKVGIPGDQRALTDGDSVTVTLERSIGGASSAKAGITIPIAAAKITPTGPVVFTVSSSTLVAHPVVFGPVVGSQVAIVSGITPEMDIVTDARGLSEGQKVSVEPGL